MKNASWQLVTVGDNLLVEWQKWDNQLKSPVHNKILKFLRVGEMADSVKCFLASMKTQVLIPGSQVKSGDMAHACRPDWGVKTPWLVGHQSRQRAPGSVWGRVSNKGKGGEELRKTTGADPWLPRVCTRMRATHPMSMHTYLSPHTDTYTQTCFKETASVKEKLLACFAGNVGH